MVSNLTIKDMGYYDVSKTHPSGGIASEEIAYGSAGTKGTVLNLNGVEVDSTEGTSINKNLSPFIKDDNDSNKRHELGEVDKQGIEFPVWNVKGVFDCNNIDDLKDYGRLKHMIKTKGVKQLGVDTASTCEMLEYSHYGEREYDTEATKTVTLINVRIVKLIVKQKYMDGPKIEYTLTVNETDPWSSMA